MTTPRCTQGTTVVREWAWYRYWVQHVRLSLSFCMSVAFVCLSRAQDWTPSGATAHRLAPQGTRLHCQHAHSTHVTPKKRARSRRESRGCYCIPPPIWAHQDHADSPSCTGFSGSLNDKLLEGLRSCPGWPSGSNVHVCTCHVRIKSRQRHVVISAPIEPHQLSEGVERGVLMDHAVPVIGRFLRGGGG